MRLWMVGMLCMGIVMGMGASAQVTNAELVMRLESLEGRLPASPVGQADLEVLRDKMDNLLEKERNHNDKRDQDLQQKIMNIREDLVYIKVIPWILGLVGAGIVASLWSSAKDRVRREISQQLDAHKPAIQKWVTDANLDLQLVAETRLLIFSGGDDWLVKLLRELGFLKVESSNVQNPEVYDETLVAHRPCDIVVFDQLPAAWINGYMQGHSEPIGLSYWVGPQVVLDPSIRTRVAFANSSYTLYARLMEAARFRHLCSSRR